MPPAAPVVELRKGVNNADPTSLAIERVSEPSVSIPPRQVPPRLSLPLFGSSGRPQAPQMAERLLQAVQRGPAGMMRPS